MADALSWLRQMLGGGDQQGDASVPGGNTDALSYLKRYLATSGEALSEAPAGIARGVGDVGQMLYGLAQRQGMAEAGLPPPPESELAPLGPGARTLGGAFDFLTSGMTHGAVPQGAGYAARQATAIPQLLADETGAIRAYHGSPALFAPEPGAPLGRFRWDKIGTGEGAQAYGYAPAYVAEHEPVARGYRDQTALGQVRVPGSDVNLSEDPLLGKAARHLYIANGDYGLAADRIRQLAPDAEQALQQLKKMDAAPFPGHMYEVQINAEPEHFLDWDKPLSQQHPKVENAIADLAAQHGIRMGNATGARAYNDVAEALAKPRGPEPPPGWTSVPGGPVAYDAQVHDPAAATNAFREAGIPGIRYLDQGSRGAGDGTHNYAVWMPELITIMRRYGILPPLAAGAAGAGLLGAGSEPPT